METTTTTPPAHRVHLFEAGSTSQLGAIARRGGPWRRVRFPALVAVIEHAGGVVVVDTGYSPRAAAAARRGLSRIYSALLPVRIEAGETLQAELSRRGLGPVTDVILTHLHLDHVGGLADLLARDGAQPRVVVDRESVREYRAASAWRRLVRGWVPGTVPADLTVTDPRDLPPARGDWARLAPLPPGWDVLGDTSVVVVELAGHAGGHLGVLVRALGAEGAGVDLLLAGDAAWDVRAVTHGELPSAPVRLISHDWAGYVATIRRLRALLRRRPSLLLLPAHDEAAIARVRRELAGAGAAAGAGDDSEDGDEDGPA